MPELMHDLPWLTLTLISTLLTLPALLLLLQVLLALLPTRHLPAQPRPGRIAVLVPAHNEGSGLCPTLAQARAQIEPQDCLLVVADNCSDDTADQARRQGATVVERHNTTARGKGYALDFGVRHLETLAQVDGHPPDVVIVLDADCQPGPNFMARMAALAHATGRPVQAINLMQAANNSLKARVAEFAWRVKNRVRPRGMHRIGLPCGLYGTGMAFPWKVAVAAPLASGHLAEDMQLGVRLAQLGTPPLLCEDALVTSVFASSQEGEASQRTRWEHGHLAMLVGEGPRLLWQSLRHLNLSQMMQVLDMLVPPLALLTMASVAWTALQLLLSVWLGWVLPLAVSAAGMLMIGLAILIAQQRFANDLISLAELGCAPLILLSKLPIYLRFVVKRQVDWVRTQRDS